MGVTSSKFITETLELTPEVLWWVGYHLCAICQIGVYGHAYRNVDAESL